jgi:hypothetical protein
MRCGVLRKVNLTSLNLAKCCPNEEMKREVCSPVLFEVHRYNCFSHLASSRVHRVCINECYKLKMMALSGITFMPILVEVGLMFQNLRLR